MTPVKIRRYTPADEKKWNDFVAKAKNATFLFDRKYMDYHAGQFKDHSLLIYLRDVLSAVFVANEVGDRIEAHGGLTYGGLVLKKDARMTEVLSYFHHILKYYSESYNSIVYKSIPSYLTSIASNEDQYAMFLLDAKLTRRDAASVITMEHGVPYQKGRKHSLKKSTSVKCRIVRSNDPKVFWEKALIPNLSQRFNAKPVHSAAEMKLLMDRFPENIQLYELHTTEVVAGAVVYVMNDVVHTQYLSASEEAKENGLLDKLIDYLLNKTFPGKSKFSFGTSNGEPGNKLNQGLINWKEGFGAHTFVHDFYEIPTSNYRLLAAYK